MKLLVINHICTESTQLGGGLSFQKKNRWISEIDICICSRLLVNSIQCVRINQDVKFPSDHAPLTVEITTSDALDLDQIINRAMQLTDIDTAMNSLNSLFYDISHDSKKKQTPGSDIRVNHSFDR